MFVCSKHVGVLAEANPHTCAEPNDSLNSVSRHEGIAQQLLRLLADSIYSAGALNQPDDRPRQVVVDDDRTVLKVLALAENIGGDHYAQFIAWGIVATLVVACWAELPRDLSGIG